MTFTADPPTRPGFYAWKSIGYDHVNSGFYSIADIAFILAQHEQRLWCRLAPAEDVRLAYFEGLHEIKWNGPKDDARAWAESNARKVFENIQTP